MNETRLARVLRFASVAWPHLLRGVAMALAALSLAWGVAITEGLVAAMLGAVLGVVAGQLLGRSRLRLAVAVGGVVVFALACWEFASIAVNTEFVPRLLGPGNTLATVGVVRFGSIALGVVASLRAIAVRRPTATALELGAIGAAVTTVFAAHRDGVIARPLWLSDWAWQNGFDPSQILLGVGVLAVGLLAVLLLVETRSGRSISSLLVLVVLATLAMLCISVVGTPQPHPLSDLGLTNPPPGEPPHHMPPRDGGHGGERPNAGDGGGQSGGGHGDGAVDDAGSSGGDGSNGEAGGAQGGDGAADGGGSSGGDGSMDGGASGGGDSGAEGGGGFSPDAGDSGMGPTEHFDGSGLPPPQHEPDGGAHTPSASDQLNEQNAPSTSPAPMAVILLDDDYSPPSGAYYFRQESWSQFNGTRLVATTRADADGDQLADYPTELTPVETPPPAAGRTHVHAMVAMLTEHAHPFALESPVSFSPTGNPNPQRFVRAYRFDALAQTIEYRRLLGHTAGDHRWSPELRAYYTDGPDDPRYAALAHTIVQRLPAARRGDPFAQALAIKLYLDHELIYSTRARHNGVADPTADFLFGSRTGYCVHFAHAAAYLWRSLGIPARIGTGYHYDEANRHGGSAIVVRAGDAHAWPELYLDGVGWIVLDIAAERNLDPPGQPADDDLQRLLGEMARGQPPNPNEPPRIHRGPNRGHSFARDVALTGLWAVLLVLGVLYAIKLWRRVIPAFAGPRALPRVSYRAALDGLAEAGYARAFGETREDFARRVAGVSVAFEALTRMHVAARLGEPARGDSVWRKTPTSAEWRRALSEVRRQVARAPRWWKRWLGVVNPASFLDAR